MINLHIHAYMMYIHQIIMNATTTSRFTAPTIFTYVLLSHSLYLSNM